MLSVTKKMRISLQKQVVSIHIIKSSSTARKMRMSPIEFMTNSVRRSPSWKMSCILIQGLICGLCFTSILMSRSAGCNILHTLRLFLFQKERNVREFRLYLLQDPNDVRHKRKTSIDQSLQMKS